MPQGTNTVAFRYVKEVTPGTVPTTGWTELRYTGESLAPTQQTQESAEILASREEQAPARVAVGGAGDLNFEMHYGTYEDFLAGALGGAWTTDVLKVGTVLDSFSLEKKFGELTTPEYQVFPAAYVNTLNLDISVRQMMTGSIGFISNQPSFSTTQAQASGNPAAVNTNPIFNGVDHISVITEGGGALSGVQKITLGIDNGIRVQDQLGSLNPIGKVPSKFKLRGTIVCYLASSALINKFTGYTTTSLGFTIGVTGGLRYDYLISKIKYTDGKVLAGGGDQDVMVELSWSGFVDATNSTLSITRHP